MSPDLGLRFYRAGVGEAKQVPFDWHGRGAGRLTVVFGPLAFAEAREVST
jgi:hypothetical protein